MEAEVRAVFFGTPEIALPSLQALFRIAEVAGVVCQPDRPAGRRGALREPPVKVAAREAGIRAFQPEKVRSGELRAWLEERSCDVGVVLAYGRILPPDVLAVPRLGILNLHASLLPKYRGAAPVQWAIVRGETETGISLMQMVEALDAGPVYSRHRIPIGPDETGEELSRRLAGLGAQVVTSDLSKVLSGELVALPQDEHEVSWAPPLERKDGLIDWAAPARKIHDRVRGLARRPGAHTMSRGRRVLVTATRPRPELSIDNRKPGELCLDEDRLLVGTGNGETLEILRAQLEGRRELSARDLIHGRAFRHGEILGE